MHARTTVVGVEKRVESISALLRSSYRRYGWFLSPRGYWLSRRKYGHRPRSSTKGVDLRRLPCILGGIHGLECIASCNIVYGQYFSLPVPFDPVPSVIVIEFVGFLGLRMSESWQ